ncbi:hypothetical protein M408DRAFT_145508 [Serendipita vermifera MAFF 305830]|uniref:Uncharacterized protein n=1 Tax=Serendipita vermifera MAFF 305830 TaxID=933852 RepID=A0A0C2XGP1_SERVB|nr:hypothetical protein M408DRAFT_145508 [Serendipita vermifera MAFF 305830]
MAIVASVKCVVFVFDAVTRSVGTIAKHLYPIMSAITSLPSSIPTLPIPVFTSKLKTAEKTANSPPAPTRTQTILERELENRRQASISWTNRSWWRRPFGIGRGYRRLCGGNCVGLPQRCR